jgi:acetyltransferase-like isoleucine patch superfamily enzyme
MIFHEIYAVIKLLIKFPRSAFTKLWSRSSKLVNIIILKQHGVIVGKNTEVHHVFIFNKGKISLGENVRLNSFPDGSMHKTALSTYTINATIDIGDNSKLNGTVLHCNEKIFIGKDCLIGPGTVILDNDSHRVLKDPVERRKSPVSKPVMIEDNVWIGMNCIIMKGVHIGSNSIIAAGTIVTKDVPDDSLFGGNPGAVIRKLL